MEPPSKKHETFVSCHQSLTVVLDKNKIPFNCMESIRKIILDTDFLLIALKHRVDIFNELSRICDFAFEIYVLDTTVAELAGKKMEKLALSFIEAKLRVFETGITGKTDEAILKIAGHDVVACTQDKELKEKLKKRKIPVITIRQKKHLVWD